MKKAQAKSSARHPKKPPLKLPLPWLVIAVFSILLVLIAADFLPPSPRATVAGQPKIQLPHLTELSPSSSPLVFTLQKIEILPEDGDTLWSLAEELYGDGTKWNVLAAENNLRSGRLTKGKTLTVSGGGLSRKILVPERLYRISAAQPLSSPLTLPDGNQLQIPTEKTDMPTSPDGSPIIITLKIGNRTETYGAPAEVVITKAFLADLAGRSYTAYLYPDPVDLSATDLALFNLTSLR